ncbi:IpaD/SipD/SspD family type III secretion system needle tip protein [Citrobacter pasteurii]
MSTSVTTAGQNSFSILRTTTNAVSSSPEVLQASTTAGTAETGTRRQQVMDILTEKLAVYSDQYHQLLNKWILIDTTPAQGVLKSSLSRFMNTGVSSEKSVGKPLGDSAVGGSLWDITFDKNMDKDGDGKIDDDIDFSTYIWSNDNDHDNGVNYPESDWEIYADVSTELAGLQTDYMDVYTDLANQSVEFLDDVNSFKARMVTYISSDEDKMKIDVGGVQDELDAIIDGWGIYDADGNINLNPINPETTAGPYPDRGPVAIRGLDAQGVYYWAEQLALSDQLAIATHTEAGADGKMNTGNPGDDIDNITVVDAVTNLVEPPEEDCRLYLVMEADGTYTLYVYPDLQPVRDAKDATFSLIGNDSDASAGTTPAGQTATNADVPRYDSHYYGNQPFERDYDKGSYAHDELGYADTQANSYFVIPSSRQMMVVSEDIIKTKGFVYPDGYTLITSTSTKDYHEYDCFLVPSTMVIADGGDKCHLTEDIVLETESSNIRDKGPNVRGEEAANIYVSDVADWDFDAHGVQASPPYTYRENAGSAYPSEKIEPPYLNKDDKDLRYSGDDLNEKTYSVVSANSDMFIVPIDEVSNRNYYIPDGYTLISSKKDGAKHEYYCVLIPTTMLDPAETNFEAGNSNASVHVTESVIVMDKAYDMNGEGGDKANIYVSPASTWDFEGQGANDSVTISSGIFNEWENSMNTMSSTVESQSQVMSEKLSQANTIFNNLTKVLSSTIEALQETQKEFLK